MKRESLAYVIGRSRTQHRSKAFRLPSMPVGGEWPELNTGLVRISRSDIYLYSYRCPECGCYDVASKGKLLAFALRSASTAIESTRQTLAEEVQPHAITEKANRTWK